MPEAVEVVDQPLRPRQKSIVQSRPASSTTDVTDSAVSVHLLKQTAIAARDIAPFPRLTDRCLQLLVARFEKHPVLNVVPPKYQDALINKISIDLPITLTAPLIAHELYWKRVATAKYPINDLAAHGLSWKRLVLEKMTATVISQFVPGVSSQEALEVHLKTVAPYVQKLVIPQLKARALAFARPIGNGTIEGWDVFPHLRPETLETLRGDVKTVVPVLSAPPNHVLIPPITIPSSVNKVGKEYSEDASHLDTSLLLQHLTCLTHLDIYYGLKDSGMSFEWAYQGMTQLDATMLAKGIALCPRLESLSLRKCELSNANCQIILQAFPEDAKIQTIDLQHNKLSHHGLEAIATLLRSPTIQLKELNLYNNPINADGFKVLGDALGVNHSLTMLNVGLTGMTDEGLLCLIKPSLNKTSSSLRKFYCAGNRLTRMGVDTLVSLLLKPQHLLTHLDLSSNRDIKDDSGKAIFDAIKHSTSIVLAELRGGQVAPETLSAIHHVVLTNARPRA